MRSWSLVPALTLALLAGACGYLPGAYVRESRRRHDLAAVTAGCFEVALTWHLLDEPPYDSPTLTFHVANRCDHPARLNLASMSLVARYPDARLATLRPYDPHHELNEITLDTNNVESFDLQFDNPWFTSDAQPRALCLDIHRLDPTRPASDAPAFGCLARTASRSTAVTVDQL